MKAKFVYEAQDFERGKDPIEVIKSWQGKYTIDWYYSDHPSIDGSFVADFVYWFEGFFEDENPSAKIEMMSNGFSDGFVNVTGGIPSKEMMKKLKNRKEETKDVYDESPFGSFEVEFGGEGLSEGDPFDPDSEEYAGDECPHCGGHEVDQDDHCWDCDKSIHDDVEDED